MEKISIFTEDFVEFVGSQSPWTIGDSLILILLPFIWFIKVMIFRIRRDASSSVQKVKEFIAPTEGPRFRKRDKIEFMGRRVFRNAKAVGSLIRGEYFFFL